MAGMNGDDLFTPLVIESLAKGHNDYDNNNDDDAIVVERLQSNV